MAKKRTKKQARKRIDSVNIIPDSNPLNSPRLDVLLDSLNIIENAAKAGAKVLVEVDPLDRLAPEPIKAKNIVNRDVVIPLTQFADMVNDPTVLVNGNGQITRTAQQGFRFIDDTLSSGRQVIRDSRQFAQALPIPKRKRKKNPKLAKAFKQANAKLRTKSGRLRKGKTQADVARLAQRLLKRMK